MRERFENKTINTSNIYIVTETENIHKKFRNYNTKET